jgi:nucleotide-binding universal stress UspA family protein
MYSRILVPLDGSKIAENVLPYARFLAAKLEIPTELISVVEMPVSANAEKVLYLESLIERAVATSQEYLARVAKTFAAGNIHIRVEKGNPEEVILANAEADAATLIAMGTHGRSGLSRWLLGSIAEKIVREAKTPVFLVRAKEHADTAAQAKLDSIIVPLDGSKTAENVLPHAAQLATALKVKIVLLQAFNVKEIIYSYADYFPDVDELQRTSRSAAAGYLEKKKRELEKAGLDVLTVISEGEAAETIIELAQGSPQSLIVMCTHGRTGVRRWMLGSITEKVIRHADDPVLAIRATKET